MQEISKQTKVFSCPSKVLIMGGYAILSEQCVGLCVGLNQKFYAYVTEQPQKQDVNSFHIRFVSQQIDSAWEYPISATNGEFQQNNPFLESVVKVLQDEGDISMQMNKNLCVFIYHDALFYSSTSRKDQSLSNEEKFIAFDKDNLHKTGLGSSACVLVSTLGCLLHYFNSFSDERLHYLSQKANFLAQKKIGSGFDIATSVFGSQVYRRFPPNIFVIENTKDTTSGAYQWDNKVRFNVPQHLKVVMVDLAVGSDTRVLAGEIKKYLDKNPKEASHFYSESNRYALELQRIFSGVISHDDLVSKRSSIQQINKEYRCLFKQIGVLANVETEPDVLSLILDDVIVSLEQVIYAVCPGAGGYDAICLLVLKDLSVQQIQNYLDHLKPKYPTIKSMIAQQIDVSLQGFSQLSSEETEQFFHRVL